ncbi:MAG TPA: prolipoprotein diacylglyceryl transferase [Acidimicrobiales bacterium]|nr:prolipoprotein diacylglyceryl transferase [Acidimicrobiales bacterium]
MLAAIPYTTFPTIELGPLNLRTFGLMVALGVLLGAWVAASYAERFGVERDETYRVGTWMVLAGIVGSRLTWALTHTDQIDNPVDVIAIWEGGIQFSGGFICAIIVGLPFFRRWSRLLRWRILDGYAFGLAVGLAFGRIGCYAVGEHFGRTTDFFLASRYDGGEVREPMLGDVPLVPGTTFHNTSLYEFIYMMVLFGILGGLVLLARRKGREVVPGTLVGVFVLYYGVMRFLSDSLRVNDERVLSMTGAQWMCLVMVPAGIWILWKVRPGLAALADEAEVDAADGDAEESEDGTGESEDGADGAAASDEAGAEATTGSDEVDTAATVETGSTGATTGTEETEDADAETVDAAERNTARDTDAAPDKDAEATVPHAEG